MSKPCDPCTAQSIGTNHIKYDGPNLPCTGIQTCNSLTVSLQKVDEQICDLKSIVQSLQEQINELTTTTTTTTVVPTTTTTTTTEEPTTTTTTTTVIEPTTTTTTTESPEPTTTTTTTTEEPTTTTTTTLEPTTTTTTTTVLEPTTTTTTTTLEPTTTTTTTSSGPVVTYYYELLQCVGEATAIASSTNNSLVGSVWVSDDLLGCWTFTSIIPEPEIVNYPNMAGLTQALDCEDPICSPEPSTTTTTTTLTFYSYEMTSTPQSSAVDACNIYTMDLLQTVYASTNVPSGVSMFYADSGLTTPFNGGYNWFAFSGDGGVSVYSVQISPSGTPIGGIALCSP